MNVPSKKSGTKDVVKIENRELDPEQINRIALISPNATINIIRNYEVIQKNKVTLKDQIQDVIKCLNPNCITNGNEPVKSLFSIIQTNPISIRCGYCDHIMEYDDIVKQF